MGLDTFLQQNRDGLALGAGLLAQGGNVVSQMITNAHQEKMMHDQMKFNAEQSALQRQFAVQQWERETAYNSPANQMARLKSAGINPALAYSSGSIANEAAASPSMSEAQSGGVPSLRAPMVDPLTAAQILKTNAETEAIEHQTSREDEKQPDILEQLKTSISLGRQEVNNLSMLEQVYSIDYLNKSLAYHFQNTTFNDSVSKFHEELRATRLGADFSEYQLRRGLQLLPFELLGFDLSNKKLGVDIQRGYQDLKQMRAMLPKILREYDDKHLLNRSQHALNTQQSKLNLQELSLKQLEFWLDAADNRLGFDWYLRANGDNSFNTKFDSWILEAIDDANKLLDIVVPSSGVSHALKKIRSMK